MPRLPIDQRARNHIKALAQETKHQLDQPTDPAIAMFLSGIVSGLAAAVQILDGGTAESALETMYQRLTAAVGQAYLDGKLGQQPLAKEG
jgi:hypothetical protein